MIYYSIIILLSISLCCIAQQDTVSIQHTDTALFTTTATKQQTKQKLFRPNNLKVNLYGLLVNNYSIFYERMIAPKLSVQLGYRYQPYAYLTEIKLVNKLATNGTLDPKYFSFKTGNYAFTADVRLYTGKKHKGAKGIFFSLYGRYTHFDVDNVEYTYVTDKEEVYDVPLVSNLTGFGGGILSGIKWIIKKRITIELYTGIHYLQLKGPLTSNKDLSGLSDQDKSDLKNNVEDIFTFGDKKYLTAAVSDTGITGTISGPAIGIRSCLSIGFVF